jgi:uncharacterized membrane protein (DUF2068 family)
MGLAREERPVDWSLFGCARHGHVTYAPDEPDLRDRLMAPTAGGTAWRCLRCGTFVTLHQPEGGQPGGGQPGGGQPGGGQPGGGQPGGGQPGRRPPGRRPPGKDQPGRVQQGRVQHGRVQHGSGPAAAAPLPRRGNELRDELILRVFAVERFLRFVICAAAAYGVWRFKYDRADIQRAFNNDLPAIRTLYRDLGFNLNHSKLLGLIQHSFTLDARTLTWLAIGLAGYALIELTEGVGLWLGQRWGEYFAMVATSVFLPYEIYDLTVKITWLRIGALMVNLLLVVYLVWSKRLFGVRGGKLAYEARLRTESVMEQAALAAAALATAAPAAAVPAVAAPAAAPSPAKVPHAP